MSVRLADRSGKREYRINPALALSRQIPEERGTYILLLMLSQTSRLEIGRLGTFDLVPGNYAYVRSAFGWKG